MSIPIYDIKPFIKIPYCYYGNSWICGYHEIDVPENMTCYLCDKLKNP